RQVGFRALADLDQVGIAGEHRLRVVGRGAINDDDLEIRMAQLPHRRQRLRQKRPAIVGVDDDGEFQGHGLRPTTSHSKQSPFSRPEASTVTSTRPCFLNSAASVSGVNMVWWKSPSYSCPP